MPTPRQSSAAFSRYDGTRTSALRIALATPIGTASCPYAVA